MFSRSSKMVGLYNVHRPSIPSKADSYCYRKEYNNKFKAYKVT